MKKAVKKFKFKPLQKNSQNLHSLSTPKSRQKNPSQTHHPNLAASSASSPPSTTHTRHLEATTPTAQQRQLQFRKRVQQQKLATSAMMRVQHQNRSDPSSSDDGMSTQHTPQNHGVVSGIHIAHNKTIAPAGLISETYEMKNLSSFELKHHAGVRQEDSVKTVSTVSPSERDDTMETTLSMRDDEDDDDEEFEVKYTRSRSFHGKGAAPFCHCQCVSISLSLSVSVVMIVSWLAIFDVVSLLLLLSLISTLYLLRCMPKYVVKLLLLHDHVITFFFQSHKHDEIVCVCWYFVLVRVVSILLCNLICHTHTHCP
jgi:hypothetical protein